MQSHSTGEPCGPPLRGGGQPRDMESALAIYSVLVTRGSATHYEVGVRAGLDEARIRAGFGALYEMGLVRVLDGRVEAVDPDAALALAMDTYMGNAAAQLQSARALSETTQALLTVFRPEAARLQEHVVVKHYENRDSRESAMADLDTSARESVDSLHPGPMPPDMAVLERSLEMDAVMVRRGVRVRALYPRSLLQSPKYTKYLNDLAAAGIEVRAIDHAPHDLLIYDRHTVVIPGVPNTHSTPMALVRGAALVQSYVSVFEDYWLRATPLSATPARAGGTDLNDQERAIIRLMANGYSDDRIARTLGIARRTVQRVMTKLMERLQVSSRFEVGFKLARSLDPTEL